MWHKNAFIFFQLLDVFGQRSNVSLVFDFMETDLEVSLIKILLGIHYFQVIFMENIIYCQPRWDLIQKSHECVMYMYMYMWEANVSVCSSGLQSITEMYNNFIYAMLFKLKGQININVKKKSKWNCPQIHMLKFSVFNSFRLL